MRVAMSSSFLKLRGLIRAGLERPPWTLGNQQDLCIRIELTNENVAFFGNVRGKPTLSDFFVEFSFDFGETLGVTSRYPIRQGSCLRRHKSFEVS